MRVLVTNTQTPQAYAVIRALRPYAARVIATFESDTGLRGRWAHGANSRLVDKRYGVPSPVAAWQHGGPGRDNTAAEDAFIQAMGRICERERIHVIFPSWDPYVYVLAKNSAFFESRGVVVPVPDFDTVVTALDKYRTVEAARAVGFPCPRTYLYEDEEQLRRIAEHEPFPLVIKPRFTSGGHGMQIVRNYEELAAAIPVVVSQYGKPMIQEYIPGGERGSVQYVLGRNGELMFAFRKTRHRKFRARLDMAPCRNPRRPTSTFG